MMDQFQRPRNLVQIPLEELQTSLFNQEIYGHELVEEQLAKSISENGQITPITVWPTHSKGRNYNIVLSGSRRLAALKSIGAKHAICDLITEPLTEDQLRLITLEANRSRSKTPSQIDAELAALREIYQRRLAEEAFGGISTESKDRKDTENTLGTIVPGTAVADGGLVDFVAKTQGISRSSAKKRLQRADSRGKKAGPADKAKSAIGTLARLAEENNWNIKDLLNEIADTIQQHEAPHTED